MFLCHDGITSNAELLVESGYAIKDNPFETLLIPLERFLFHCRATSNASTAPGSKATSDDVKQRDADGQSSAKQRKLQHGKQSQDSEPKLSQAHLTLLDKLFCDGCSKSGQADLHLTREHS